MKPQTILHFNTVGHKVKVRQGLHIAAIAIQTTTVFAQKQLLRQLTGRVGILSIKKIREKMLRTKDSKKINHNYLKKGSETVR